MIKSLLIFKYSVLTLVFLSIAISPILFVKPAQAANSSTISYSGQCSPTFYYAGTDGKYIGDAKTIAPGTGYHLKLSWKNDTCKTVGSVQMGEIYTENGKTMQKLYDCFVSSEFKVEGSNKAAYLIVDGSANKEGKKLRNYAFIGDSSSNCSNPPTTPREYVRTTSVLEISTTVKKATAGNTSTTNNTSNTPTEAAGTKPDTSIGANINVNLDEEIGRFWNPFEFESVPELLANLLRILFVLIGIAAVVVIIIAGFRMVLASGNEEELTKAKKAITWAIIGLIVSLMSFSIVAIIQRLIQVG